MTRTQNSFFNFITSIGSNLLTLILSFVTRTVFIRYLSDYLGIEGLFSNILSMLSLADLGFGTAVVFKLYKPIEEQNHQRIRVLMKLYQRVYFVVGWVVVLIGVCLIPALPVIVKDYGRFEELHLNAVVIFLLYLFSSASSYWFFAYKNAFVSANQKTYVLTIIGYVISIAGSACQIIALAVLKSFIAYLLVQIITGIVRNTIYAIVCDKRYPFLKVKTDERISREERKEFVKDVSSMFLYRVSNVVINSTDNIILSAILGLTANSLYYPYTTVRVAITNLLYTFLNSIQASLGSLHSTGNLEWSRLIFRVVNLFTVWIYGVGAIGTAVLLNEFIPLWVGEKFVFTAWTYNGVTYAVPMALLIGIEIFVSGQKYYCGSFREATGLFQQLKYRPVASMIVNLVFSILLVPRLGIAGCVVSTIIAALTTNLLIDPYIIHKYALKQSSKPYYIRNLFYKLILVIAGLLSWRVCVIIPLGGIFGFIVKGCVCVIIPSAVLAGCVFRTSEFRFLFKTILSLVTRKKELSE